MSKTKKILNIKKPKVVKVIFLKLQIAFRFVVVVQVLSFEREK